MNTARQHGFSAVELLIALLIASMFVIAGYQLFAISARNTSIANQMSQAANLGYEYLRKNTTSTGSPCAATASPQDITPANFSYPGLKQPKIYKSISCPSTSVPNLANVTIKVTYLYGTETKEVSHATYTR